MQIAFMRLSASRSRRASASSMAWRIRASGWPECSGKASWGGPTVTRPEPIRSAARADRRAAPPLAGPPARIRAWPWLYLCWLANGCFSSRSAGEGPIRLSSEMSRSGQMASSLTGRKPRLSGLRSLHRFNPMSATINSPHRVGPRPIRWPGLGLSKATVSRAGLSKVPRPWGKGKGSPLSKHSPLGQSTATSRSRNQNPSPLFP